MSDADTPRKSPTLRTLDGVENSDLTRRDADMYNDNVVGCVELEVEERAALGVATGQIARRRRDVGGYRKIQPRLVHSLRSQDPGEQVIEFRNPQWTFRRRQGAGLGCPILGHCHEFRLTLRVSPGLGRSYAFLLASRGARVVVNDLGTGADGRGGPGAHPADAVVAEIIAAGGEAVADTNSVAEPDGVRAIVQTAIDAWGQVDILINNAGVFHATPFDEMSDADVARLIQVHLLGNTWMCRSVWPFMTDTARASDDRYATVEPKLTHALLSP